MDDLRIKSIASRVITQIFLNKALNSIEKEISPPEISLLRNDGRLLIGRLEHACNPEILIRYRITHILNVCQAENLYENGLMEGLKNAKIGQRVTTLLETSWMGSFKTPKYLRCPISDKPDSNIRAYFEEAHQFIKEALSSMEENRVLIHCQAGVSRSATICISYFMAVESMSLEAAFSFVKVRRPIINPNAGFMKSLQEFEAILLKEKS